MMRRVTGRKPPKSDISVYLLAALLVATLSLPANAQEISYMHAVARGSFKVDIKPQADADEAAGVSLGRMSLQKTYEGDLVGTARGTMLSALTPVKGSAGYVAIERVSGTLHGRAGSFVLQHTGTMDKGAQQLSITIVPDSGTDALVGITGVFRLRIEGGEHFYELEYSLPE